MPKAKDLSGQVFGDLTLIERTENYISPKGQSQTQWLCQCACGKVVIVRYVNLMSGNSTSCGCSWRKPFHGMKGSLTYSSYTNMLARCATENDAFTSYKRKDIKVDKRWVEDFLVFLDEMGERPSKEHWIDRIDPDKGYYKENCRWLDDSSMNSYNTGIKINNTSGRTGVSYYCQTDRWEAYIGFKGEHIKLGYFLDFESAVKAREEAEIKYYGINKK